MNAKVLEKEGKQIYHEKVEKFVGNIYRFQEIPKEEHRMEECIWGEQCTRKHILHKLTHKFPHKATFIAHSLLRLAGLEKN